MKKNILLIFFYLTCYELVISPRLVIAEEIQWPSTESVVSVYNTGWHYVMQAECAKSNWTPNLGSPKLYQASVMSLLEDLQSRIGNLPGKSAGEVLEAHNLLSNDRYSIQWVRLASRLPGVSLYGYLARPIGVVKPTPAVVILHSGGVPPHTAFGWRLNGDTDFVKNPDHLPLSNAGITLVDAGYTVFVPSLSDDQRWYWHWYEYDRWGESLAQQNGGGNTYGLLLPLVMTSIDFLTQDPQVNVQQIAVMGWEQGAQLAAVTAALDKRVTSVIWLGPLVDKQRWRASNDEVQWEGAAFEQMDCAFGQVELAALLAPRSLLFSYSPEDLAYQHYAVTPSGSYLSEANYNSIKAIYAVLGASDHITQITSNDLHTASASIPVQWLNQEWAFTGRTPSQNIDLTSPPADWSYPTGDLATFRNEIAGYLAHLGSCPADGIQPDYISLQAFQASVQPLHDKLYFTLGRVDRFPERPITLIERQLVMSNEAYKLEWVRFLARFPNADDYIGGFLATPLNGSLHKPAVLSFMGYEQAGLSFGVHDTQLPYAYLNNYGDYLARSGYIVFMPSITAAFDGWGAMLNARTNHTVNIWNFLIPYYMSGVDFLLAQSNVDPSQIAAYGLSYGGIAALYTAALDSRISTLVYSNFTMNFQVMMQSTENAAMPVWLTELCSTANSALQYLITPRRMIWENGLYDYWNQFYENYPTEIPDQVGKVYQSLGFGQRFQFIQHNGYHETRPWLFSIFYPKPAIETLVPAATNNILSPTLQVKGTNFRADSLVRLNDITLATTFIDSTILVATLPKEIPEADYTVTVENFDGYTTTTGLIVDRTPPIGTLSLGTEAENSHHITLSLSARDDHSGITEVRLSEDADLANTAWQPYTTTLQWKFSEGDGQKSIHAQYRDRAGNFSPIYSQTFFVDSGPPQGTLIINGGAIDTTSTEVTLDLHADDNGGSGVAAVYLSNDGVNFTAGISLTNSVNWRLVAGIGKKLVYARYKDALDKFSPVISAPINLIDTGNQAIGVLINGDTAFINSETVTLTVIAPANTAAMAIRDSVDTLVTTHDTGPQLTNTWVWEPYTFTRTWQLKDYGTNFPKRITYVQLRDTAGVISQTYFDDAILDRKGPTGGIKGDFSPNTYINSRIITLTLFASDDLSGVNQARLASTQSFTETDWQSFSPLSNWQLSTEDGTQSIYAQYRDNAGNLSSVYSMTVMLDTTPPQLGSITVHLQEQSVKIQLEVTDTTSGLDVMQISSDPNFNETQWMPFAPTLTEKLPTNSRNLYMRFRDKAGNISNTIPIIPAAKLFLPRITR